MADPLVPDYSSAVEFLRTVQPDGPWTVVAIEPNPASGRPRAPAATFDDEALLVAWLERHGAWNLYFTVNRPRPDVKTTPEKGDLTHLLALHVDVDLPKDTPPSEAAFGVIFERLRSVDPPPTALVFSGGGFQAFWRLFEPLEATSENLDRVEAVNRAVGGSLAADHCWNANRLMRLPGTVNRLSASKIARGRQPALAYAVSLNADRTWAFGRDPVPRPVDEDDDSTDVDVDPRAPTVRPTMDDASTIADLPAKLQRIIRVGDAANWGGDRSRLVFYVVCSLVRRGWTDDAIAPILRDRAFGVSAHVLAQANVERYVRRQIASARAAAAADWERTHLGGIHPASRANAIRAIGEVGAKFSHDTFADRLWVNGAGPLREVSDHALVDIRFEIDERCGFLPARDLFAEVAEHLARRSSYHPVRTYLDRVRSRWDAVPRLETWLVDNAEAEDTPYVRAVSRLILLGAVRRVREPGCKFDEMLVLVNPEQGTDKSSALQRLATRMDWFTDSLPLNASAKQVIERLSGKWIVEASDLSGYSRADVGELKDFLSRRYDRDRLAYARFAIEVPRQSVFFGTTNSVVFLKDDQNRRFWPVNVGRFNLATFTEEYVEQLWAEASTVEATGASIRLDKSLWAAAAEAQLAARANDPWMELLDDALGDLNGRVASFDLWTIVGKPGHQRQSEDDRKIAQAMRELGFARTTKRWGGGGTGSRVRAVYERGGDPRSIYVHRDPLSGVVRCGYEAAPSDPLADPAVPHPFNRPPDQPDIPL